MESFTYYGKQRKILLECKCRCGNIVWVEKNKLKNGHTKSCGCLNKEKAKGINFKDGRTNTKEYNAYYLMISRCYNNHNQRDYAQRGIFVCDRWRKSFENFLHDMGCAPSPNYSLDRIDNNKGYSPSNCRWATTSQQNNNKRNNHKITYDGESYTISQLAELLHIKYSTLRSRIRRGSFPIQKLTA